MKAFGEAVEDYRDNFALTEKDIRVGVTYLYVPLTHNHPDLFLAQRTILRIDGNMVVVRNGSFEEVKSRLQLGIDGAPADYIMAIDSPESRTALANLFQDDATISSGIRRFFRQHQDPRIGS